MISKAEELHRAAMQAADGAVRAERAGRRDEARYLFHLALRDELAAVGELMGDADDDPSMAVVARCAATLTLECGKAEIAARIALRALEGSPLPEVRAELLELLDAVACAARNRNTERSG